MTTSRTSKRIRLAGAALAVAGVFFFLYVAVRPWHDESTVDGAVASLTANAWVAAHLFAVGCYVLVPLGLLGLRTVLARTRSEPLALVAAVTSWIGAGFTLPYYGAEDFALHAIAGNVAKGDLLGLIDAVRFGPAAATTFAIGLVLMGIGSVFAAVAVWRSGVLPRYSGLVFAVSFVLLIPQFYMSPAVRIGHGALVAIGLCWLTITMWRSTSSPQTEPAQPTTSPQTEPAQPTMSRRTETDRIASVNDPVRR